MLEYMVRSYGKPYRRPSRARANYRTRPGYATKTIVKGKKTATTTKMVQIAKNVVMRNQERKLFVTKLYDLFSIKGMGIDADPVAGSAGIHRGAVFNALNIAQGTQQDQRIGNAVKTQNLTFRGVINSLPHTGTNTSLVPFEVHLVWYKMKKYGTISPSDIKVGPANTLEPIKHTLINTVYPWNRDKYIIKAHKVFRLRAPPASNTANSSLNSQSSNAPYFHRFHVKIPCATNMTWEDGVVAPSNDWLGFVAYVINGDGLAVLNAAGNQWEVRAQLSMDMVYSYTDA